MKKIFAVVGLIMALSIAAFGYSPGITFGADYDLVASTGLGVFAGIEVGTDAHNFEFNIGTKDLLDSSERFLWLDTDYFIGYVQSESNSLVAGISTGIDIVFDDYDKWSDNMLIDNMNFFVRGEVFDLIPELWGVFGFYGQLNIVSNGSALTFGGLLGGTLKLPW